MGTNPKDDSSARLIATDITKSVIAKAPAGSGKTTLLVTRFLTALKTVDRPESVLAITFTRKAAAEMRHRIVQALLLAEQPRPSEPFKVPLWDLAREVAQLDQDRGWHLLENPDRLRVMTIDSLNVSITRHAPLFSGIGAGVPVEDDVHFLYREAVLSLMPYMDDPSDPLSADIQSVMSLASNRFDTLCELLSPLLATRDQWLQQAAMLRHDPSALDQFLDRWLTSLIAGRLTQLREHCGPALLSFASAMKANNLIPDAPTDFGSESLPDWRAISEALLTTGSKPTVRKTVNKANGFPPGSTGLLAAKQALEDMGEIDALPGALVAVRGLPAVNEIHDATTARAAMARVLVLLAAELKLVFTKSGRVDHIEVAMRANIALREAGGSMPLLQQVDETIRHLMVDEAQDTSISQIETLRLLTEGWQPGDGRTLFIVGDPQQSIYAFRQAEVRLFLDIWSTQRFGGIELARAPLTHNYRSSDEIIDFANDTFGKSMPIRDEPYSGSVAYVPSVATQGPGGAIHFTTYSEAQPRSEAAAVAEAINALPANETAAILVRSRAALQDVLPALRDAGITYACQDIDLLTQTDHIRDLLALVKALWHPLDRASWVTLLRAPFVGLSWSAVQAATQNPGATVEAQIRRLYAMGATTLAPADLQAINRLVDALEHAIQTSPLGAPLSERAMALWNSLQGPQAITASQYDDVLAAFQVIRKAEAAGVIADLPALERSLTKLFAVAGEGRVQVMTIHKAKGLEFDHVILPGLWRKQPPEDPQALIYRSVSGGVVIAARADPSASNPSSDRLYRVIRDLNVAGAAAEDLRLLYVAFTRAKRSLHLYAMTKVDKKTGADTDSLLFSESLLESIWPAIRAAACGHRQGRSAAILPLAPSSPRTMTLTEAARGIPHPKGYTPAPKSIHRPSEKLLRPEFPSGIDSLARNTGIVFHALVDRWIKTDRGVSFEANLEATQKSMVAGFRRLGTKRDEVDGAVTAVTDLARSMLNGFNGRWILAPRDKEGSEQRIGAFKDQKWLDGVIDRYFVERATINVIDYKTSTAPSASLHSKIRHGAQIADYSGVLKEALGLPTKGYVYYPKDDVLHLIHED